LVWATAGHGAAAGSRQFGRIITAILEQAAGPVFGAAGIKLTTRSYGWATDKSAPGSLSVSTVSTDGCGYLGVILKNQLQSSQHSQQERQQRERKLETAHVLNWAALQIIDGGLGHALERRTSYDQGWFFGQSSHFAKAGRARRQWADSVKSDVMAHIHRTLFPMPTCFRPEMKPRRQM
jgi:hypothetical protein